MIELGFLSSRNIQSVMYESSLVLHVEKRIELGPCNVMLYSIMERMDVGHEIWKRREVGVNSKKGLSTKEEGVEY
jgi:hypothetical protein